MAIITIAVFFVSAAVLGLELVLVRTLSIGHWNHLSFLVISTALLGFGAGGTFVSIGLEFLTRFYRKALWVSALAMALTIPIVFGVSQKIPLDELQLIWDRRQILYLFMYYLLFFVPFFCAACCIALAFSMLADKAHRLYFYNMAGSGLGAVAIVGLMYGNTPQVLLLVVSSVAFFAAAILALDISWRWVAGTLACAVVWILTFGFAKGTVPNLEIRISENKSLAYYSSLPNVETIAVRYSPLARLDCIKAASIRYFPGLSINYMGKLPIQRLIISDADGMSAVNQFEGHEDLQCFDSMTSALGYHLTSEPDVCIIGAGGGSDVAQALAYETTSITAVEMNSQIVDLVRNKFSRFTSGLYSRDDVEVIIAEGRNFLQTTDKLFDIINISLLDSFSASTAGLYTLNESHLYTVEAVEQAIAKLYPTGMLSITRNLKMPPRDSLKMLATLAQTLRRRGIKDVGRHIIMIRSWATATLIVSPQQFTESQIASTRSFAEERGFDIVHLPGIKPDEINRYHILDEPFYYQSARQILSSDYKDFYRNYTYNIRPASDDKPYFFDFFKWKAIPHMIRTMPRQWLPFSEWGYLVLAVTLLQAVCAGVLFILLPLWISKPIKAIQSQMLAPLAFFSLLGLAYMFLEMGFIQKMTLLIGHPVFGVTVTLLSFLVFSGLGALVSGRLLSRMEKSTNTAHKPSFVTIISIAAFAIIVIGIAEITVMTFAFDWLVGFSTGTRMLLGATITAPLAFFMGIPFPTALKQLNAYSKPLVPWVWGVNGFASVIGTVLGTFLAISVGFTILTLIALSCYLLVAFLSRQICG